MACRNLPSSIASEAAAEKLLTLAMQVMPCLGEAQNFPRRVSSGRQSMLQDCGDVSYSFHIRGECCFYIPFSLSLYINTRVYGFYLPVFYPHSMMPGPGSLPQPQCNCKSPSLVEGDEPWEIHQTWSFSWEVQIISNL